MAQAYVGTIKSFNMQSGWGHIECEQTHQIYGKDIFLLRSQVNGLIPTKGDQVYFDVTEGQKGAEAANVQIISTNDGTGAYIGTMKSWNPVKGWGHIECETTHNMYAKDIFVMRSAIPGGECHIGDQVSFSVQEGTKGVEASGVTILHSKAPRQSWPQMHAPQQSFLGSVKNFDEEKGWGHIICDQTRQMYGKDMFVLRSALNGQIVTAGQQVRFTVAMGTKGPEAHGVCAVAQGKGQVIHPPVRPPAGVQPSWSTAAWQQGAVQWQPVQPVTVPFSTPQMALMQQGGKGAAAAPGQMFTGTVKNWNEEKGWGFVSCQETMNIYGKDIFLHKKELYGQTPLAGSPVHFGVQIQATDGRPIAISVSLFGAQQAGGNPAGSFARASPY